MTLDVVLSSGFLAFARHLGVLRAVHEEGHEVSALCGTSSGAFVGALWAAGHSAEHIEAILCERRPYTLLRPSLTPWRGICETSALQRRLAAELPDRIEDLPIPFAVGVYGRGRTHRLLTRGPLVAAVAASCAMPYVFNPVRVDGVPYRDGGAVDRLGWQAWMSWRGPHATLVHVVARTAGRDREEGLEGVCVVRTPRSGASFLSLGDVEGQALEAERLAREALAGLEPAPAAVR